MTGDIERAEDYKIIKNHDLKKKKMGLDEIKILQNP